MPIKSAGGGVVTKEFHAYLGTSQTIATGTNTKIQFDTEVFDPDNVYDNVTNYRYVPAEIGKYYIYARALLLSLGNGKEMTISLQLNGAAVLYLLHMSAGVTGAHGGGGGGIIDITSTTDYIEVYVQHNHGGNLTALGQSIHNYFGGYKLPT